jgi:hypothetical protein
MARKLGPKDIEANRSMVRSELIAQGMPLVAADAWCAAWEVEAERLGIDARNPDFWTIGSVWIREQHAAQRRAS